MLKTQFEQMQQALTRLEAVLAEKEEQLARQTEAREQVQQQSWHHAKRAKVLEQSLAKYQTLQDENERFKEVHGDLTDRLRQLLVVTRSLAESLRQ